MSGRFNIIKEFIVKPIKNVVTGGSKTSPTISSVKTNVPTTKLEKKSRDLKLLIQKNKASKAKLNNTLFDIDQASKTRIERKFGGGADMGKKLSAKQMKIASLAGNKKKIDGADFKKLKAMKKNKTPMEKAVKV